MSDAAELRSPLVPASSARSTLVPDAAAWCEPSAVTPWAKPPVRRPDPIDLLVGCKPALQTAILTPLVTSVISSPCGSPELPGVWLY